MTMNTPILLVIYRRPQILKKVINAIRPLVPTRIYIACDGPNPCRPDEAEKVAATRALIEREIDWPCQIERLYSDLNQGCRLGVSRAISWFFEQVEEGIILEDDCIPHPDFFHYCTSLLECYRHDTRVWSICGSNFQLGRRRGNASYYFSIHGDSWGWATWRRAWKYYGSAQQNWEVFRASERFDDVFPINAERVYWTQTLDKLFHEGKPNSWAFQWWCTGWMNNALHVWPNTNLVSNVGFGGDCTHTRGTSPFAASELQPLSEIVHPDFVLPSRDADSFSFYHRRQGRKFILQKRLGPVYFPLVFIFKCLRSVYNLTKP